MLIVKTHSESEPGGREPAKLLVMEVHCNPETRDGLEYIMVEVTPSFIKRVRTAQAAVLTAGGRCMQLDVCWGCDDLEDESMYVDADGFNLAAGCDETIIETCFVPIDQVEEFFNSDMSVLLLGDKPEQLRKKTKAVVEMVVEGLVADGRMLATPLSRVTPAISATVH